MNKIIIFIALLSSFNVQAQIKSLQLKRGFYYSFDAIQNGQPTRNDSFKIVVRSKGDIVAWGGSDYTFELVSGDKSEYKKIKKEFIGVSDGQDFFSQID